MKFQKDNTCCFTGHRNLPRDRIQAIARRLDYTVESLIAQGVTNFISGGALGFDTIAASLILTKRDAGKGVRLILVLPCHNQDERWDSGQREIYRHLLAEADEVTYVSEEYHDGCMKKRNQYMVDHSAHCVCALLHLRSGTGQTVRYAKSKRAIVVNLV